MNEEKDKAREIIKRISDAALELAFIRHDLTSDQVDVDDDADVKSRVAAHEEWLEDVKDDVLNCLTGDDTGCLDPEELDQSNCELLWIESELTTARREAREEAFKDAGYIVRQLSLRTDRDPNRYLTAAAFKTKVECALEAAATTEKGERSK